jgi:glycerol-3-phosphate acyltransferase PlsY
LTAAIWIAIGFLAGSIPFGLIVARLFFKTDIRTQGSGNIGAANALRSLGAKAGAAVLILDALKGFLPIALAPAGLGPGVRAAIGFAAVAGHCFSPWLGGRGGKGVATALGAILALSPLTAACFVAVWLAVLAAAGFASLCSMTAAIVSAPLIYLFSGFPAYGIFGAAAALLIVWKHRENIERLRAGTESKLKLKRSA